MLQGDTFLRQYFSVNTFAAFIDTFLGGACGIKNNYLNSFAMTYSGNEITIKSGLACIKGRFLREDSTSKIKYETIPTRYCKLVIEIDLSKDNEDLELKQAYYRILYSGTGYPTLTQEDIVNNTTGIYQFELAQFTITSNQIGDWVDKRSYVDFDSIYNQINTTVSNYIANYDSKKADKTMVQALASGSPLVASSTSGMTDKTHVYVNTSDGKWYYWNGSAWTVGGVYQATQIADGSVTRLKLSDEFVSDTNNFLDYDNIQLDKTFATGTNATIYSTPIDKSGFRLYPVIKVVPGATYISLLRNGTKVTSHAVGFYDIDGKYVSHENKAGEFTIPSNVHYVYLACNNTVDIYQFKRKDISTYTTEYEPFKKKIILAYKEELKELSDEYNDFKDKLVGIDKEFIDSTYITTDGRAISDQWSGSLSATNFIKVNKGLEVTIENFYTKSSSSLCGYDSNKNFVVKILNEGSSGTDLKKYVFTVPNNVCYIRYTIKTSYKDLNKIYYSDFKIDDLKDKTISNIENKFAISFDNLLNKSGAKPIISLIDDDTTYYGILSIKSICDSLGIKCTFACITSGSDGISGLNNTDLRNRLLNYQSNGFHITTHSNTHNIFWKDTDENFSLSNCESDLIKSIQMLNQYGFLENDYLVTPFGTATTEIQNMVSKWCKCLISSSGNNGINHLNGNGRYKINRLFIKSNVSLDTYKTVIDNAFTNGDWLIFGTHSGNLEEFNAELLTSVLQYAQQKGIEIMPINQAWKIRKNVYDFYDMF